MAIITEVEVLGGIQQLLRVVCDEVEHEPAGGACQGGRFHVQSLAPTTGGQVASEVETECGGREVLEREP